MKSMKSIPNLILEIIDENNSRCTKSIDWCYVFGRNGPIEVEIQTHMSENEPLFVSV